MVSGKSFSEICQNFSELNKNQVYRLLVEGIKEIYSEDYIEQMRLINATRLDFIYSQCISSGDYKTAIKAIETQAKLFNNKPDIQIDGDITVGFNF